MHATEVFLPLPLFRYDLCMITNEVMDNIFNNHSHRISQWNDDILNPQLLQEYADVIHAKGASLENCFGFIDGTVRPIARPDQQQRIVYTNVFTH